MPMLLLLVGMMQLTNAQQKLATTSPSEEQLLSLSLKKWQWMA
ncbi:MAG: hypothetical protein RIR12_91 [Bacteroidota bacterium]